jgi:ATP-dependent RNA helicase DeaD
MSSALPLDPKPASSDDFASLGLAPDLCAAVRKLGFTAPTPIQDQSIAALLQGNDMLGQAATGTGKTAAFGLPLLQRVLGQVEARRADSRHQPKNVPDGLVLVPTRELAIQVAKALTSFCAGGPLHIVPIYGGQDMRLQLRALAAGAHIVVATPGRLIDHLQRRSLDLQAVSMVVLDEADEMLDRGFAEDLGNIFSCLPEQRQTAMFSATLSSRVGQMAQRALHNPVRITVSQKVQAASSSGSIRHLAYLVPPAQRPAALCRLLSVEAPQAALIFCRTRADVDVLCQTLGHHGLRCEALHGGMLQPARDKVMRRFRKMEFSLLVATDVAARGLDIDHISHVVNYEMPEALEVYMHRVGRTGRAGRSGVALSFVHPSQRHVVMRLKNQMNVQVQQEELPTAQQMGELQTERTLQAVSGAVASADLSTSHVESLCEKFTPQQLAAAALLLARGDAADVDASGGELGLKWTGRSSYDSAPRPQYNRGRRFSNDRGRPSGHSRY